MNLNIDSDRLPDVWGHESYIETSGWDACHSSQKERQLAKIPWQWKHVNGIYHTCGSNRVITSDLSALNYYLPLFMHI